VTNEVGDSLALLACDFSLFDPLYLLSLSMQVRVTPSPDTHQSTYYMPVKRSFQTCMLFIQKTVEESGTSLVRVCKKTLQACNDAKYLTGDKPHELQDAEFRKHTCPTYCLWLAQCRSMFLTLRVENQILNPWHLEPASWWLVLFQWFWKLVVGNSYPDSYNPRMLTSTR